MEVDNIRIYLAHSSHEQVQGKEIEKTLLNINPAIKIYNPFDKENPAYEELHHNIKKGNLSDIAIADQMTEDFADWIVDVDLEGIRKQDALIMIFPPKQYHSVGGVCEMFFASRILQMPVFTYAPPHLMNHPWVVSLSDVRFESLENLYEYIEWFVSEED